MLSGNEVRYTVFCYAGSPQRVCLCPGRRQLSRPADPCDRAVCAGRGLDISTRLIGQKLTEKWVRTSWSIAARRGDHRRTEIASKAAPDGYTVLMITTTFAINPGLHSKLPYDPGKDFTPVSS